MTSGADDFFRYTPSTANDAGLYTCPVCGWAGLTDPPYNQHGHAGFDICPCCYVEFGYEDATGDYARLRSEWIESGMSWHSRVVPRPQDWDPIAQLKAAGF